MQSIINNAINCIDKTNVVAKIIPILNKYKEIGTNKFIEENKIENFFNKFDINELYALNVILDNNHEPYNNKYKNIFNKIKKEKEMKSGIIQNYSLFDLLDKIDNLNNDELNFLYELVENASSYLSSIQDYSYVYKDMIEDFDINEYPVIMIYKLGEIISNKIENRKERNKQLIYKNK